jgi:hypothetical protein
MAATPQDNMAWLYAKQSRDHAANMTHELAKALVRIEELEAKVQALEIEMLKRR